MQIGGRRSTVCICSLSIFLRKNVLLPTKAYSLSVKKSWLLSYSFLRHTLKFPQQPTTLRLFEVADHHAFTMSLAPNYLLLKRNWKRKLILLVIILATAFHLIILLKGFWRTQVVQSSDALDDDFDEKSSLRTQDLNRKMDDFSEWVDLLWNRKSERTKKTGGRVNFADHASAVPQNRERKEARTSFAESESNQPNPYSEIEHRAPPGKKPSAFITLCTSDSYALPSLVLFHRLRVLGTKHELAVLTDERSLSPHILQTFHTLNITIHTNAAPLSFLPRYVNATKHPTFLTDRDRNLWGKLRVWELEQYDKVVLIDSDVIIFDQIDELFDFPELSGCAMIDSREKISFYDARNSTSLLSRLKKLDKNDPSLIGNYGLNSGVIVLKPNRQTLLEMYDALKVLPQRPCCPTQEFLHRFFEHRQSFHVLPDIYNARRWSYLTTSQREYLRTHMKIYHFVERSKPWMIVSDDQMVKGFKNVWWKSLETLKLQLKELGVVVPPMPT